MSIQDLLFRFVVGNQYANQRESEKKAKNYMGSEYGDLPPEYLQLAFQKMLQRNMETQKQKEQMDIAQKAFTPTVQDIQNQAIQQYNQPFNVQGLPSDIATQRVMQKYNIAQQRQGMKPAIPERIQKIMKFGERYPGAEFGEELTGIPGFKYKSPATMGMQPVIDPATGALLFSRPKGSVFQPETPSAKQEREVKTAQLKEEAKTQRATTESIGEFQGFIKQFERSYDELANAYPTIGATGIGGFSQRLSASIGEKAGYFPETSAFLKEIKPMANKMARTIEGGRVTDEDRKIYADSFANALSAPSQTNIRLASNALLNAQRKGGDISLILGILQQSDNPIINGIANTVNQMQGQTQSQQNDLSTMSDAELQKIANGE